MRIKPFLAVSLVALPLLLISWGSTGHKIISGYTFLSFTKEMEQFKDWKTFLVDHASDADYRRNTNSSESPKHYIDIDNYPEFVSAGKIEHDPYLIVAQHGRDFVVDNGTLPWATISSYDSLEACFKRRNWEKAKIFAADLGHYVADAYMPMHITNNYDGKLTGNTGIHSLYETAMLSDYGSLITYTGDSVKRIEHIDSFVFNYIYANYPYVDSVLIADTYARSISGTSTAAYRQALWAKSGVYTVKLCKAASQSIADLFYSAWYNAGRPLISGGFYTDNQNTAVIPLSAQNESMEVYPNPAVSSANISYSLNKAERVRIEIIDSLGKTVTTLVNSKFPAGNHTFLWNDISCPSGSYFVRFRTSNNEIVRKLIISKE